MRVLGTWLSFRIANGTLTPRERTKAVSFPWGGGGDTWGVAAGTHPETLVGLGERKNGF